MTFTGSPIGAAVGDANANPLPTSFLSGGVNILGPTAAEITLSGRVVSAAGGSIANARVSLTDSDGNVLSATSSGLGYFQIDGVRAGETYVLTATSKRYSFSARTITTSDELSRLIIVSDN